MAPKYKIYLAHPISGMNPNDIFDYYITLKQRLEIMFYQVMHPMTGKGYLRTEKSLRKEGYSNPVSTNHAINTRDLWMVRQADIVLVDLTGTTEPSIGCIIETAAAHVMRKHIVAVIPDGNVHEHGMLLDCIDIRFYDLPSAEEYLEKLISGIE